MSAIFGGENMIAFSHTIPGYTVVTTSDGMHLLVPQPRVPIAVDFAPPRKRPHRVAKRIAARGGRMHYPRRSTP